jgi:hypothetical protein
LDAESETEREEPPGTPETEPAQYALYTGELFLPRCGERLQLSVRELGNLPVPNGRLAIGDIGPSVVVVVPPGTLRAVSTWCSNAGGWGPRATHLSFVVPGRTEAHRGRLPAEFLVPAWHRELEPGSAPNDRVSVDSGWCWCVDESAMDKAQAENSPRRNPSCLDANEGGTEGIEAAIEPYTEGPDAPMAAFSETGIGDGVYLVAGGFDADGRLAAVHIDFALTGDYDPAEVEAILRERSRRARAEERGSTVRFFLVAIGCVALVYLIGRLFQGR